MRKWLLAALAGLALGGVAYAQYYPGTTVITSMAANLAMSNVITAGPQNATLPMSGGTFTCSSGSATIANTAFNAGSIVIFSLATAGGTVAQPFLATTTPGTGFTVTCGGSDSSSYNYSIFG